MTTKSMIFTGGIETCHAAFEQALIDLPVELSALEHVDLARIQLEGVRPLCFVVDPTTEIGRRVCADARLSNLLADVPVVAVVDDPWGPETTNALVLGVDDYLPRFEAIHLRTKVRVLLRVGPSIAPESAPSVVIADPDRERRVHIGRHLRRMGMDVQFATDAEGIRHDEDVKLVVAHANLAPFGGADAMRTFREDPSRAAVPWVFTGTREELEPLMREVADAPSVSFFDVRTDAAQTVATANQLLRRSLTSQRRSARLPYESAVRFDVPGSWSRVWGMTYNLSLGGLFVRTLTSPPIGSTLDATFIAPASSVRITLRGTVVWRVELGDGSGHPPGFGMELAEPLPRNEALILERGYERLFFWHVHSKSFAAANRPMRDRSVG